MKTGQDSSSSKLAFYPLKEQRTKAFQLYCNGDFFFASILMRIQKWLKSVFQQNFCVNSNPEDGTDPSEFFQQKLQTLTGYQVNKYNQNQVLA